MSNGLEGIKWMNVGRANITLHDITEHITQPVHTNEFGWGQFFCKGGSVSVWIQI